GVETDLSVIAAARIQVVHPVEATQKGRLAAAGGTDQRRDLIGMDLHRDILQGTETPVVEVEAAHFRLDCRRFAGGSLQVGAESAGADRFNGARRRNVYACSARVVLHGRIVDMEMPHHLILLRARYRNQMAMAFMKSVNITRTRPAAAALDWKAGSGREIQLNIWMGRTVKGEDSHSKLMKGGTAETG